MNTQPIVEKGTFKKKWCVMKYAGEKQFAANDAFEVIEFDENVLLNEGIAAWLDLIAGTGAPTAFDNASANLGVGDGVLTALTGTSAFTNGSAIVTGTGTLYLAEVAVGDFVRLDADDVIAEVLSVDTNTQITLKAVYAGAGGVAAASSVMAAAAAADVGLAGVNKAYASMAATYPQRVGQTLTWRAVFTALVANFHWREATVANGNSDAAVNANRKIQELGVKASGAIWTLDLQITLA